MALLLSAYQANGTLTSMTTPVGGETSYKYDSMGRITESVSPVGSISKYTYNAQGLLKTAENARGQQTQYEYLKNGWIKSFTDNLGTVKYTYDSKGKAVKYSYYKTGTIKAVIDWNGNITAYEYDGNGQLTKTTRPDGSVEMREYDKAGQLIRQEDTNKNESGETVVINRNEYTYSEVGDITSTSSSNGAAIEELSKMTSASMEYDDANRLIRYNGEEIKYDADGNMLNAPLNGQMENLAFDCRGRLISAGNATYEYGVGLQRIGKTIDGIMTEYTIDYSGALSRVLTEETNGEVTYYIYGIGLIAQEQNGDYLYYHYNNTGDTQAVTNESGKVVERFAYSPFGELLSENASGINFLYNGEFGIQTDADTGLLYMRARYYHPVLSRFISEDPIKDGLNWYAFADNNPILKLDPLGLDAIIINKPTERGITNQLGQEHMCILFQDKNGEWYYCSFAGNYMVCEKIPSNVDATDLSSLNNWVKTQEDDKVFKPEWHDFSRMTYVEGDFTNSLTEANKYKDDISEINYSTNFVQRTIDKIMWKVAGGYDPAFVQYSPIFNSCGHVAMKLFAMGEMPNSDKTFGEDMTPSFWEKAVGSALIFPNAIMNPILLNYLYFKGAYNYISPNEMFDRVESKYAKTT